MKTLAILSIYFVTIGSTGENLFGESWREQIDRPDPACAHIKRYEPVQFVIEDIITIGIPGPREHEMVTQFANPYIGIEYHSIVIFKSTSGKGTNRLEESV